MCLKYLASIFQVSPWNPGIFSDPFLKNSILKCFLVLSSQTFVVSLLLNGNLCFEGVESNYFEVDILKNSNET